MTGRFQGMLQIARFNPWFYVMGALISVIGGVLLALAWNWLPAPLRWLAVLGFVLSGWWLVASLAASHLIYDRSDWLRGNWLHNALMDDSLKRVLNVHSGFDETTARLRAWLPETEVVALDLFDPDRLTERSIHRARSYLPPLGGTLRGSPERWPAMNASFDAVCFLLSAHEFRIPSERANLFRRAHESLRPGGCVILVEHVRDAWNFVAFGPGFFHFYTPQAWCAAWKAAEFRKCGEWQVTPWLRVWRLQSNQS